MKLLFVLFAFCFSNVSLLSQSADDVITNYFNAIGGLEKIKSIKTVFSQVKIDLGDEGTIPVQIIQKSDGKQIIKLNFQGHEVVQWAFDGSTCWETNFELLKPQRLSEEDSENAKRTALDVFSPFIDYQSKGYTAELLPIEKVEGTPCYKIKLTLKPQIINKKEVPFIQFHYFDTENYLPILIEEEVLTGEDIGKIAQTFYAEFQEVNGIYFPFSILEKNKNEEGDQLLIQSIELNKEFDDKVFLFPN